MAMVSVIIPAISEKHLNRTIESVYNNTSGEIEVIVILDGAGAIEPLDKRAKVVMYSKMQGRRVAINDAARLARGKYLFILDGHCSMSQSWDAKLVEVCEHNTIVISVIQDMRPDTWELRPGKYSYVYLNRNLEEKWWGKPEPWPVVSETMCFTGCAWLIPKTYFWALGGYDESLGPYGWDGPEWTLKVWLNPKHPGRLLLRTDVICGHIFGTNEGNKQYPVKTIGHGIYYKKMMRKWGSRIEELFNRFPDAPDSKKGTDMKKKSVVATTVIEKKDEVVQTDSSGKVISKKLLYYKPFVHKHDGTKSDASITKRFLPQITEVEREEVLV